MDRRAAGALLALAACIASSAAAPTVSNQTALDIYDAASEGCYYNFQHYGEGDRIMTNEPCLNCTCHNRMLMCYLRVCPFTKPIGQDCTVEKRADQCCPIVTCPDVPVDLLTSTSTSSPAEYGATGLGKLDKYGCSINGKYFPEGSKVPPTPNKPCEHCYCIRNMTTCVMQECTLHVDGCTPIYHKDVCCPVRYSCDHPEDEMPLLDDMSTTVRPTPGFLLTTTTLSPVTQMTQDCVHNDQIFPDGTSIKTEKACEHCYCMKGDIVCVVQECGTPMENEGKNCTSVAPREGQCCPDTYICEGDEVTTELTVDYTTEPFIEKLTTLAPPRRVLDEGSGYRKEEEPIATELPTIEPEVEGSGEEFATVQPSDGTEKETPSLFDERISSTEDVIGRDTTPQSDIEPEKLTTEPDSELNTVPSGTIEPLGISEPQLTTVSDDIKSSEGTDQTHVDSQHTTASIETKGEEILAQTTEPTFKKEDGSPVPIDITSAKEPEYYSTTEFEPTKTKDEGINTTEQQEPVATVTETKFTTPASSEDGQTETETVIPITTARDELDKEPSFTVHDHTTSETPTMIVTEKSETTTLNAQENEIEDVSTTQGPGRIPGEGDCLQNGITYRNESVVPSMNNCQTECKCISSIIKCDPIICSDPPVYMSNCVPTYDSLESCCPTYVCDGSKETLPPQPHSQMSEIPSSTPTPAFDCEGDQCEIQKADKYPEIVPSDIPQTGDCGSADCKEVLQTPVPMEVQPECTSEDCGGETQPESQNKPSTISPVTSESCSGSECQQQPAENEDFLQSCEGENCKTPSIQRCQNEEDCKTDHVPEVKLPCEGESCKLPPESHPVSGTICEGENCKVSPLEPCQNEEDCKMVNVPKVELPCEGESCKLEPATETTPAQPSCEGDNCDNKDDQGIECVGEVCKKKITPDVTGELPTQCSDEGCEMSPETSPVGPICEGDSCKIPPIEPSKVEKPCEGESCKLEPTECNDEGCKTAPETSPTPTCEGENCKISPNEPCQNEDECKPVNVPKLELPCEGESCKLEPATETTPAQPSCEGDSCDNKDDQGIECVGEECKNKITPDVTGELPTQCDGTDCLSKAPDSPEKTDVLSTEVPLSTQDKDAETPAVTTEYLDSTKSPEFTNTETPLTSEAMGEGSTDKSVEVTELEPAQTKYATEYPERKTTEYEVIKETTPVSDLEIQTEGIHELEVMTTPHLAQDISNKEPEISQTTELVTNYPELQESAKPSEEHEVVTEENKLPEEQEKPEDTTEKQEKDTLTTVLPETKLETETTEPAIHETPAQSEQETSPESTSEPEISTNLSLDEQYTAVPKLDSEKEATTESNVKSTEQSVLDDKMQVSETETTKDSEETSKAPVEIPVIDEKISTTPSVILDISTEESRSGTPAAPESPTTSSDEPDKLYSKTELPDFEKQEPIPQTTSVPEPQIINQEPDKKDDHTTDKLDIEPSTSQASIIFKTDEPDTETPIVDKHKIPDLPSEEVFTESPEINTEEPSYTAHQDEASPQEPIEPESPYIPVYPTISDNLGSDLIDKEATPGIVPELASSTEKNLYSTASELIPEAQTQEPSVTYLSPKIEDDTKTTPLVDTEQYEHDMRATEPSVEISPTDTRKYNKDTTESPELITKESPEPTPIGAVLTTTYPTEEKQTESSVYSEPTTSKPLQEKEQFTTEPAEIFNTEKQEVMPTETPESHVKETESEFKLSTAPEMVTTEKLRPIETEEPQTTSPSVTEPTESQSPSESVEMEKESDENLGKVTSESPKQTSEPKYEYSETTPDMIELVEHNEISTLPSSISDERITVSPATEKSEDNLATETPLLETDFEKATSTSHPLSEDTEDKMKDETLSTPSDITKDNEAVTNPQDVDSHETDDNTTLKPESEDTKPESIPVHVTTTEIIQINKDHSTELPDITSPEQITEQAEGSSTEMSEISDTHTDELTTKQPERAVTDFGIRPEDELATEEPGSGEMEVKPDKDYLTEKPEIEHVPTSEYESSSLIPEQPSVDIQPVTDKSKDTTPTEVPKIDNEIQPEKENIEPTIPSLSETEKIPGEDIVTVEPEYAVTKAEDLETVQEEFTTENPTIPDIKPEVESSTEHQLLPGEGVSTGKYDIAVTEKETQELTTQKPEPELPEIESSSSPAALEDGKGSQSSTAQPESVTLEQSMTTEKEFVTELSETSEPEQETKAPGTKDDIQPDSESLTISPEKEYTTARPKVDLDTTIKTPTISSEPSDEEKELEHTTDSKLSEPEHKLPSQEIITEQPGPSIDRETVSTIEPTERVTISEIDFVTEEQSSVTKEDKLESSTEKMEEQATISLEPETETTKPDITEEPIMPELGTKEPEISENIIPEHATEPQRQYTTDNLETSSIEHDATSEPILIDRETSAVTEHGSTLEQETGTKEPQEPEEAPSSEQPVHVYETTIKTTNVPFVDSLDDNESSSTKPENIDDSERLSTIAELSSESSTEKEELSEKSTEAPEGHGDINKHDEESNNSTTPGYTMRDETTDLVQETEKPTISEEGLPVHPQPATEKPTDLDLTKDTTAPEEEFLTVTTKATTPKAETETPILSEDLDKTPKPQEPQEETSSAPTSEIPKPGLNEVQATDEVPVPEEEGHFPPSATGGYGQEPDYEDENQPFGPGTCRYGGKVYVSAQQIPRDDPCDFCFCFRSDIICLQQSCPPPIHGCHEEPIQGFCCPRYECPVSMASTLNITTTTTTTTTTLPPHFLPHAYQGAVQRRGCQIKGHTYKVGEVVRASSGPCLHCTCGGDGQMKCDPKACTPEPMLRQMIAAAVSAKRRR